jgi:hypothetical protein
MAKFKVTFTATREMTLKEIKECLEGHSVEFEEGEDLADRLNEEMNDNGIEFFSEEALQDWDHNSSVTEIKKSEK